MSQHNQISPVYAIANGEIVSPGVTIKKFALPVPFGPEGWNYLRFNVTLELFTGAKQRMDFAAEYSASSYGRWTDGWSYSLQLYNDDAILSEIILGQSPIMCHMESTGTFTGHIPNDPTIAASPYELFGLINRIALKASGNQETC